MTIGIVVALPEELSTLTGQKLSQGDCVSISENILLTLAGAGPLNAERAARLLISEGADKLISWGCAAALAPNLKPGDLVLAEQLLSEQQQSFHTEADWRQHLHNLLDKHLPISGGTLAESSHIVADRDDKQHLYRQTGAVALDMESCAIAKAAQYAKLPCIVIRAIADPATMSLPQAVSQALNSQGQVELGKLLRFLLSHPWEVPELIKLGLHFYAARKTLKTVAKYLTEIIHF
ncbi:phosphorylase [Methylomonas montana]|uniref:phosphorylase family protein n=1 Tax=Methylomonas montana TaxID=3058963 RepID=UPI00265B51EA|nr:phosphorylase [Methylomonas montana]WKJ91778.1 phosphorylase [Methylomonas montana]